MSSQQDIVGRWGQQSAKKYIGSSLLQRGFRTRPSELSQAWMPRPNSTDSSEGQVLALVAGVAPVVSPMADELRAAAAPFAIPPSSHGWKIPIVRSRRANLFGDLSCPAADGLIDYRADRRQTGARKRGAVRDDGAGRSIVPAATLECRCSLDFRRDWRRTIDCATSALLLAHHQSRRWTDAGVPELCC